MVVLKINGTINLTSVCFSAFSLLFSLSNVLSYQHYAYSCNYPLQKVFYCLLSLAVDMVFRLISLHYIFHNLGYFAIVFPISYFITFLSILLINMGKERMKPIAFSESYNIFVTFVTSSLSFMFTPGICPRKYSKMIFNSLSSIALMSAFKVSVLLSKNRNSGSQIEYDNCLSYCEYQNSTFFNQTSLSTDCIVTSLPMETNFIFIGIICTLWVLSNLELIHSLCLVHGGWRVN